VITHVMRVTHGVRRPGAPSRGTGDAGRSSRDNGGALPLVGKRI